LKLCLNCLKNIIILNKVENFCAKLSISGARSTKNEKKKKKKKRIGKNDVPMNPMFPNKRKYLNFVSVGKLNMQKWRLVLRARHYRDS
jgi:hypothetical protein